MLQRAFYSTIAALLLSATLVQTASAYPTTTRTATSTVTGVYRPIDLDLTLNDGTDSLNYTTSFSISGGSLTYEILLGGTFVGSGFDAQGNPYAATGLAGDWRLVISDSFSPFVTSNNDGNFILMQTDAAGRQVGTLTYEGGHSVLTGSLPVGDTPILGDVFRLFTTSSQLAVLGVACDAVATCDTFDLELLQDLEHLGPYTNSTIFVDGLDLNRVNEECLVRGDRGVVLDTNPCGSFTLTASGFNEPSAVPEPATLALIGLGLLGLGLSRRARAR